MRRFEPLLSSKLYSDKPGQFEKNMASIRFPVFGSYKFDGWRLFEYNGSPHTRSLKHPKNYHVVRKLSEFYGEAKKLTGIVGWDGEAVVGDVRSRNAMQSSTSGFGSYDGQPDFTYLVFDSYQHSQKGYTMRLGEISLALEQLSQDFPWVQLVEQRLLRNWAEVYAMEAEAIALGYEGLMLRSVDGVYKMGRSSFTDGILTALKRFTDGECEILEVREQLANTNEAEEDAYGRTKRSSHKAGLVGKDTMGSVLCRDPKFPDTFSVGMGPGLDDALRAWLWKHRASIPGSKLTYSYQDTGTVSRPRHPKWRSLRAREDLPL